MSNNLHFCRTALKINSWVLIYIYFVKDLYTCTLMCDVRLYYCIYRFISFYFPLVRKVARMLAMSAIAGESSLRGQCMWNHA